MASLIAMSQSKSASDCRKVQCYSCTAFGRASKNMKVVISLRSTVSAMDQTLLNLEHSLRHSLWNQTITRRFAASDYKLGSLEHAAQPSASQLAEYVCYRPLLSTLRILKRSRAEICTVHGVCFDRVELTLCEVSVVPGS